MCHSIILVYSKCILMLSSLLLFFLLYSLLTTYHCSYWSSDNNFLCLLLAWSIKTRLPLCHGSFVHVGYIIISLFTSLSLAIAILTHSFFLSLLMNRYVLTTLHELVADDYILIYFHNPSGSGTTSGNNMPTFSWLKRCYHMIDRKLRKNLKSLYLVHPTFWLKTLVIMTKPLLR